MEQYEKVIATLQALAIDVQVVEHEPVLTTEQADKCIEGVEGVRTKTLFLTNKKRQNFYLVIMDDAKRLNTNKFKEIVDESKIKMASESELLEKLGLYPGCVSPFGLLNHAAHEIRVYLDEAIVNEARMSFHPNTNDKTIFIQTSDLFKFFNAVGYVPNVIEI